MTNPDPADDGILHSAPLVDGHRMLGSCRILAKIGSGAMGTVYRAHHVGFDFEVAVKCLRPIISESDPTFIEKFRREARLAARLTHPNLIRVYDVDEQNGIHFLVMELVDGHSMAERLAKHGPLPEEEAEHVIVQAALGLGVAHRARVVHRDVKPGNLLETRRGEVKVADLGLAKAIGSAEGLTATSSIFGTPPYMSPEQWRDTRSVGAPSDVYSLGGTWYALLTGRAPFRGEPPEIMSRVCGGEFPDVRDHAPDVSDFTTRLLDRCTELDPARRFADAAELAEALERRDADSGGRPPTRMLAPGASASDTRVPAGGGRGARPRGASLLRRSWPAILIGALLVVPAVAWLVRGPDDRPPHVDPAVADDSPGDVIVPVFETRPHAAEPAPAPVTRLNPTPELESGDATGPDHAAPDRVAPARRLQHEMVVRTSPRLATLYVDGRPVNEDAFGRFHLTLEAGPHGFRVVPRDGAAERTFDYEVREDRELLLDYESGAVRESAP